MANEIIASEIKDYWETMINKIRNGTADYAIGQYKPLDLGCMGVVRMQIVAKGDNASKLYNTDIGDRAYYDFVSMDTLRMEHPMRETYSKCDSWEDSSMRAYLNEMIVKMIFKDLRGGIQRVVKESVSFSGKIVHTADKLWIPSYEEIFGAYKDIYEKNESRCKNFANTEFPSRWLLRSADPGGMFFRIVKEKGTVGFCPEGVPAGIALGFSIG